MSITCVASKIEKNLYLFIFSTDTNLPKIAVANNMLLLIPPFLYNNLPNRQLIRNKEFRLFTHCNLVEMDVSIQWEFKKVDLPV